MRYLCYFVMDPKALAVLRKIIQEVNYESNSNKRKPQKEMEYCNYAGESP
jgi:hypothetical protein